jgi:endogenous inhibitor of DNA gyrase (YacG/DUF329 family)
MAVQPRFVLCPACGKGVEWTDSHPHRPFCSERCRTIDLGAWAAERYRVPVVEDKDEPDTHDPAGSGGEQSR